MEKVANVEGVHSLGGKFATLLVKITPSEIISEFLIALEILFEFETRIDRSGDKLSCFDLNAPWRSVDALNLECE